MSSLILTFLQRVRQWSEDARQQSPLSDASLPSAQEANTTPHVIFLVLRRMRMPLLVLISVYAISIGGLVLMPGMDDQGNPWRFDFFHAFYFISYTGSTIGFGEIPYAFSSAQRLWTTVAMYLTVIGWLYAIGTILTLLQDPAFKRAVTEQRFARGVRRLKVPFYLICGYGETGSLLVRALNRRDVQSVVIDSDAERIESLSLENLSFDIPNLCADVREARYLIEGGLQHPQCIGVVAMTNVDAINVKIAITCKLLNPGLRVICRAEMPQTAANLASFGVEHIIDPFNTFADHLTMTLRAPSVHLLYEWLISVPNLPLPKLIHPPRGAWIICHYGRFGKAVHRYMGFEGMPTVIVEPHAEQAPEGAVIGVGTQSVTLRAAGVDKAVGIVAGTNQDADNLSIILTARRLNPNLYLVARQNRRGNDPLFRAANVGLVMHRSRVIVWRILPLLTVPLLSRFLHQARHHSEEWAAKLLARIGDLCDGVTPQTWSLQLNATQAPAVDAALSRGREIRIEHLLRSPQDRSAALPCMVLLLVRGDEEILLPDEDIPLQSGDRLLFCSRHHSAARMTWTLLNENALDYVLTGEERPDGYLWRWLSHWRQGSACPPPQAKDVRTEGGAERIKGV
ncbi:MAG: potassium channel protein [Gammaproteobacteria bacterium]|nr:potassium channel protein [Gammaproteobacteria bacterium]MCP5423917.1 potassium channel protein [Gammaproteobacteria bacterium]MCP5459396.1 potassium channel protein [Gammaproteobacteria bacterium]